MTLYTEEVEKVFRAIPAPYKKLVVDVVEHESPAFLELRVYQPNIATFRQKEKIEIAGYLYQIRDMIRLCGVQCEILGVESAPPEKDKVRLARENLKRNRGVTNAL